MKIVLSGFRDTELSEHIISEGGTIINSISKTNSKNIILIIKNDTLDETSKVKKAKELGIKIYTKDIFEKLF